MSREHLDTYLNDHLSGSVAQLEMLDQLAEEETELKPVLEKLRVDIEFDRKELLRLMRQLDIRQSRIRKASGWIAEQLAEAKLVLDDEGDGRLRRLERLEVLALGVEGKLRLWQGLEAASKIDRQLGVLDYDWLIGRARSQQADIETLRIEAAKSALTIAA